MGCATQNQIECRCGTSEDQRVRVAASHCFRATCASDEFDDAMRFADFVCISSEETRPTEVAGDDQEELDDMEGPASTLSVTQLPEDDKQRTPGTGSTLVSLTTGHVAVETAPSAADLAGDDEDNGHYVSKGAQAGIAIGAVMSAFVLGMAGYLVVVRIRKARAAKAARNAAGEEDGTSPSGPPRPEMSELCRGANTSPGHDDGYAGGKAKGTASDAQTPATELGTARSPPPHYCHEMYVEPVELDGTPMVVSPVGGMSPTDVDPMDVSPLEPRPEPGRL